MKSLICLFIISMLVSGCTGFITGMEYTPNIDGSITVYNPKTGNTYKVYRREHFIIERKDYELRRLR